MGYGRRYEGSAGRRLYSMALVAFDFILGPTFRKQTIHDSELRGPSEHIEHHVPLRNRLWLLKKHPCNNHG